MTRPLPRLLAILLLAGAALAGVVPEVQAGERLLVPKLSGWKTITNSNDASVEVTELIPSGQSEADWTDRLTIQAFRNTPLGVDQIMAGLRSHTADVCDDVAQGPVERPSIPGAVAAGQRWLACSRYHGDNKGSYTLFTAIRGQQALFLLARAWRGQPFPIDQPPVAATEIAAWSAFLDGLRLCEDGGNGANACPP